MARSLLIIEALSIPFSRQTLKGFGGWRALSGLSRLLLLISGFSPGSKPELKLANACGVFSN
jgi:hypothetical protein